MRTREDFIAYEASLRIPFAALIDIRDIVKVITPIDTPASRLGFMSSRHIHPHAFSNFNPLAAEGLVVRSRRNFLKAGMAGLAGLTVPDLLRLRANAKTPRSPKSVILLWMILGGPSQIDTFDPKPDRPPENRGPFGTIATRIPGVRICEHLPKLAGMLDRFTVIRSVDPRQSNHEPNMVFQTGNLAACAAT